MKHTLEGLFGNRILAVAGAYKDAEVSDDMEIAICGVEFRSDTELHLSLPKGHQLLPDQLITIHLDNRTGVSEYDAELKVYRGSFKGRVVETHGFSVTVVALEYQVFYGASIVKQYRAPDYAFPADRRPLQALPISPLQTLPDIDEAESDNKVGVLFSYAMEQPHSTVMAFLSSSNDDIFFITFKGTFKEQVLKRETQACFAIDGRASFTFEHAIEWNYSIVAGEVYQIPKGSALFEKVRERFIAKNPWEVGFFSHPEVEMFHLKAERVICPTQKR
ncbi:hypothetical protein MAQ5080_01677 [Marinomonas aquimarina]|uniref:Uncharacterized protein n=1 Tax=Marinomonas aquimarina TaxID=295068 RepID=A0A1A8TF28_9GAMM|nr:hypothetical protein [Marinomonas aquimarina]SBS30468.1 hypothetical protein MAQ5080_01677 [Marinomonas aquimarina]